jgi:Cu-Zn family superoxide dismutase
MRIQNLITLTLLGAAAFACEREPAGPVRMGDDQAALKSPEAGPGDAHGAAPGDTGPAAQPNEEDREAEATSTSAEGVGLKGEAKLEETGRGLRIEVEVNSAPVGLKGIHVHEKGDCSDIRGKSMGAHFSPGTETHGLPAAHVKHLGDLGNIEIDAEGKGKLEILVVHANLKPGDSHSFLGKAIVIHTAKDLGTGESGESGEPIACAVIEED